MAAKTRQAIEEVKPPPRTHARTGGEKKGSRCNNTELPSIMAIPIAVNTIQLAPAKFYYITSH